MAKAGDEATFSTLGGATVSFVYANPSHGNWSCAGCHSSGWNVVTAANNHAAACRSVPPRST